MSTEKLQVLITKHSNEHCFIGFGNPDSKILIIGKEPALRKELQEVDNVTVLENIRRWEEYLHGEKNLPTLNNTEWKDVPFNEMRKYFNPARPFWGQLKKRNRVMPDSNEYHGNNGGTSTTWYWYQRVMDGVRGVATNRIDKVDFYNDCFITELSDVSKAYSNCGRREDTLISIQKRIELLKEPFFQDFPIVVAACGNYLDVLKGQFDIDVEKIFPNSMVIRARQLSMNVKLEEISRIISELKANL